MLLFFFIILQFYSNNINFNNVVYRVDKNVDIKFSVHDEFLK